jgi:hypothetical protein
VIFLAAWRDNPALELLVLIITFKHKGSRTKTLSERTITNSDGRVIFNRVD